MCKTKEIYKDLCYTTYINVTEITDNVRQAIDFIAGIGFVGISIIIGIIGIIFRLALKVILIAILIAAIIAAVVYFAGHSGLLDGFLLELTKYFPNWLSNH